MMFHDYSLATERMTELRREADDTRVANRLVAARRWSRLASWAQRQARKAGRDLG
ncbi:hypothetical protein GCM10010116_35800 [Microbispora rosea subsp. aerata]|nr:hypothetical protein [Microbispora rosea]GGO17722.1 hypothetical protein GCM10010116_35800 [Microbispora rosea subsp. aerata]GIH56594.1 hypothetical protein Mro02_35080 [Microbispora rosea subsp. aerata]GLJ81877.1 hypothetical protein GCM10017588_06020 [Microbispora rosea subsp. aerata]